MAAAIAYPKSGSSGFCCHGPTTHRRGWPPSAAGVPISFAVAVIGGWKRGRWENFFARSPPITSSMGRNGVLPRIRLGSLGSVGPVASWWGRGESMGRGGYRLFRLKLFSF
ncbi:hypothetical protein U9M48_041938 [Paspalum notatum var. saurae]|uniref:Uncharacterized protein n=1 Tax=Paspalum notatum var. saurae TaxID=547442 RepID=A0AAQ3XH40_PASNO